MKPILYRKYERKAQEAMVFKGGGLTPAPVMTLKFNAKKVLGLRLIY